MSHPQCCQCKAFWHWNPKVWLSPCSCPLGSCQPVQAGTCAAAGSTEFNMEHAKPASDTEWAFRAGRDGNVGTHRSLAVRSKLWTEKWMAVSVMHGTLAQDWSCTNYSASQESFGFRYSAVLTMPLLKYQRWETGWAVLHHGHLHSKRFSPCSLMQSHISLQCGHIFYT